MRQRFLPLLFLTIIATCSYSCGTDFVSNTPIASAAVGNPSVLAVTLTVSPKLNPTVTRQTLPTQTLTITTTLTPAPYPAEPKRILISYKISDLAADSEILCMKGNNTFSFVLYEDGQLIFKEEGIFKEAYLPQEAVDNLLSQVETTGYFEVKGDGTLENDPIYIEPPNGQSGPIYETVTVKNKEVSVNYPLREYLATPIKQTLELILKYSPPESHIYEPDYVGFWVFPSNTNIGTEAWIATPIATVNEWPSTLPALSSVEYAMDWNYGYINNEITPNIKELFDVYPSIKVFKEDDMNYYVIPCVYLSH
jgi:hypothetical protein